MQYLKKALTILASNFTAEEKEALKGYFGFVFNDVNKTLRGEQPSNKADKEISLIDSAMEKSTAKHRVLYRGVSERALDSDAVEEVKSLEVGDTYHDPAFMSSSPSIKVGRHFAGRNGVVLELHIRPGTPAVDRSEVDTVRTNENEILLNRGLTFTVTDVSTHEGAPLVVMEMT